MITVDALADRQSSIFDALKRRHSDLDRYAYANIQAHSVEQTHKPKFQELRAAFDDKFPEFRDFSDTKVLDLMIWQVR